MLINELQFLPANVVGRGLCTIKTSVVQVHLSRCPRLGQGRGTQTMKYMNKRPEIIYSNT